MAVREGMSSAARSWSPTMTPGSPRSRRPALSRSKRLSRTSAPRPAPLKVLETGQAVPETELVDQDGRKWQAADARGKVLALTFIYTRCPLPTFCPLMDRNFVQVQKALAGRRARRARRARLRVLRSGLRHAGGDEEARADDRRRPVDVEVRDRAGRDRRRVRGRVRSQRDSRREGLRRHHPQHANRRRRAGRQAGEGHHGQHVDSRRAPRRHRDGRGAK